MCYLVLCDKAFSKRLAYTYLEDLQTEFQNQYGARVHTVSRPYSFIEFGETVVVVVASHTSCLFCPRTEARGFLMLYPPCLES